MINHLLLGVQPSDFDHLTSRIKSLKEVFCYRLKLVLESATRVRLILIFRNRRRPLINLIVPKNFFFHVWCRRNKENCCVIYSSHCSPASFRWSGLGCRWFFLGFILRTLWESRLLNLSRGIQRFTDIHVVKRGNTWCTIIFAIFLSLWHHIPLSTQLLLRVLSWCWGKYYFCHEFFLFSIWY